MSWRNSAWWNFQQEKEELPHVPKCHYMKHLAKWQNFFFYFLLVLSIALESKIELDILGEQTVALSLAVNFDLPRRHCSLCNLHSRLKCILKCQIQWKWVILQPQRAANLLRAQDLQRPPSTSPSLLKCIGVGVKLLRKIRATLQICC